MAIRYLKNGNYLVTDFIVGEGDEAIMVPLGNLPLYSDAELAAYGVTREVTEDVPSCDPLQALLWLAGHGKGESDVIALIDGIADTTTRLQARAYWQRAARYHADNQFIIMLWQGLGIDVPVAQAISEASQL